MSKKLKLKEARFALRLSQLELYLKTGVSASRISMIENKKLIPNEIERVKLAEALNLPVDGIDWPEIREAS